MTTTMKLNPKEYVKQHEENEKKRKKAIMDYENPKQRKSGGAGGGRKTAKERAQEARVKEQKDFLLFLEKEKLEDEKHPNRGEEKG